jgi:hypothetical protein
MDVKRWRKKGCGQNRMGVCREGRQGQTQRLMVLQKNNVLLPFCQGTWVSPFAENIKIKDIEL